MIFIIIPVYNRWKYTKACLDKLASQTYADFKVVVVDHGSSDGTSENIIKDYSWVTLVKGNANMWWTAATNFGIEHALKQGADYILTLNNDTLPQNNYIEKLVYWSKQMPNALFGSLGTDAITNAPIYGGEKMQWKFATSIQLLKKLPIEKQNGVHAVTHFPGRGLLIPAKVFADIGLFDAKTFKHYMADYDFTLRAAKAGYEIYCNYDARLSIYPEVSGANQLKRNRSFKNYYKHLFGIKGGANLPLFYKFSVRHCPAQVMPFHILLGTLRRVTGFWIK